MRAWGVALAGMALGFMAISRPALGYCRTHTCDPANPKDSCNEDRDGCVISGAPLHWPSSCVTFDVQVDGSPKSRLDADTVTEVAQRAFSAWTKADCGHDTVSLKVGTFGPVACAESRYNEHGRNANVIVFHDDEWPYPGGIDTFGFTRVRFNPDTGEIVDADVEINSADFDINTDGDEDGADLQSILTHEFGHFFGLAHAAPKFEDATMRADWNGEGTSLRALSDDDVEGICEAYPPGRRAPSTCEPVNGFSGECFVPVAEATTRSGGSCASAAVSDSASRGAFAVAALLGLVWRRRRGRPERRPTPRSA